MFYPMNFNLAAFENIRVPPYIVLSLFTSMLRIRDIQRYLGDVSECMFPIMSSSLDETSVVLFCNFLTTILFGMLLISILHDEKNCATTV